MNVSRQRWALAVGTALLTAALAGLVVWILPDRHEDPASGPGSGFAPAGKLGFLLKPDSRRRHATDDFDVLVTTNSMGLRGPEVAVPKPSDRYRVLVLGDSFTFGWGVELDDAWHARMARVLRAPGARSIEVIDAGVPGWCPLQAYLFLKRRGLDLQPDLVLWQLCSNDLLEMERLDVEVDARRLPVAVESGPPLSAGLREEWLAPLEQLDEADRQRIVTGFRRGRIDPLLREIIRNADTVRREQAAPAPEGAVAELSAKEVLRGLRSGPGFGVRYLDYLVSAARALCAERGIPLRLMLAQTRPRAHRPGQPDDGATTLRAWAAHQSPTVLDTAGLVPDGHVGDFFLSKDPHWAPAAHPLVARAVARWLADDPALGLSLARTR